MLISTTGIQGRMMGQYAVLSGGNTPNRIKVFDIETREVGTYTIKDNVVSMPTLTTSFTIGYKWNPNGTSLCVTHSNSPYIQFYNKIGNTYTALANVSPTGNKICTRQDWHPNGNLVAVGRASSNSVGGQVQLWERIGDTFRSTGTFDVAITATIYITAVAWNPQGDTLAISCDGAPYLLIYKFNPETYEFVKIVNPTTEHPTAHVNNVAWNHDGSSLAIAGRQSNNRLVIYNREGDTFVKCFTTGATIAANCVGVAWRNNGEQIVFGIEASPRIGFLYRPPGTTSTFHRAANPTSLPPNNVIDTDISDDGLFVAASVYLNANVYYRRDPATTSTWINIGQNISGNPVYGKSPHIYPGGV